ncbi:MAG: hypothetical protein ABW190_15605 [Rhizobacter sp.]
MSDGIDPTGWIVILSALAFGFGVVRFLIAMAREKQEKEQASRKQRSPGEQ